MAPLLGRLVAKSLDHLVQLHAELALVLTSVLQARALDTAKTGLFAFAV